MGVWISGPFGRWRSWASSCMTWWAASKRRSVMGVWPRSTWRPSPGWSVSLSQAKRWHSLRLTGRAPGHTVMVRRVRLLTGSQPRPARRLVKQSARRTPHGGLMGFRRRKRCCAMGACQANRPARSPMRQPMRPTPKNDCWHFHNQPRSRRYAGRPVTTKPRQPRTVSVRSDNIRCGERVAGPTVKACVVTA